jgi:hypothetical protein
MTVEALIADYLSSGQIASTELDRLASKSAQTDSAALLRSVFSAVLPEFSRDVPRLVRQSITAASTATALTSWTPDSQVQLCEYPVGQLPKSTVELRNVYIDEDVTPAKVYAATVPVGSVYALVYTSTHSLGGSGDEGNADVTIPDARREAFFTLASARLCEMLAAAYAPSVQPGFGEGVNFRTQSDSWRGLARDLRKRYRELVGASETPRVRPAEYSAEYSQPDHRIASVDPEVWP